MTFWTEEAPDCPYPVLVSSAGRDTTPLHLALLHFVCLQTLCHDFICANQGDFYLLEIGLNLVIHILIIIFINGTLRLGAHTCAAYKSAVHSLRGTLISCNSASLRVTTTFTHTKSSGHCRLLVLRFPARSPRESNVNLTRRWRKPAVDATRVKMPPSVNSSSR